MTYEEILFDAEERMDKASDRVRRDLAGIRTGRANPGLVDSLKIDVYGSPTPLKQVASVSEQDLFVRHGRGPEKNPHAVLYRHLSYQQVRDQNLRVMDATAITQCMEHAMPIQVFNYRKEGNIERAVLGEQVGTLITSHAEAKETAQ